MPYDNTMLHTTTTMHIIELQMQKYAKNDRCGTRTHSLSLRRAARYHCANRPGT